jgi:hypothetical protein
MLKMIMRAGGHAAYPKNIKKNVIVHCGTLEITN